MDENFFFKAMRHVGLRTVVVDENTVFPKPEEKPEEKVQILSKSRYKADEDYICSWADDNHTINHGRWYIRIVLKPTKLSPIQTQRICLDCWMGEK